MVNYTILDCYTDEPSGLGVPPYIGTYPRYIYGKLISKGYNVTYLSIDDVRLLKKYGNKQPVITEKQRSRIDVINTTKNSEDIVKILENTKKLVVVLGVHTPGKYLSAIPGTLREVQTLVEDIKCEKILTGPAASEFGTQLEGGRKSEAPNKEIWDAIDKNYFDVETFEKIDKYAASGAKLLEQLNFVENRIVELETGSGCYRDIGCSFCVEANKPTSFREQKSVVEETKALMGFGAKHFRLGKQTCIYSYKNGDATELEKLLKPLSELKPLTLHIDNANPARVTKEITELIVKYCTSGNIAAFGVESFDENVVEINNLNSTPETTMKAIKIINEIGAERGENGLPKFLPGINILFGLEGETKKTHEENISYLKRILEEDMLIRRINIRKVVAYPGTELHKRVGDKYVKKNSKYYWKWRNQIRQEIDYEMLRKLVPKDTILRGVVAEVYDGKTTFGRQIGTYPLIVGIKGRLELQKTYDVRITGHMLRSLVGEVNRKV
ncbi:radical SAM protein [Candidatus Woesearchaeota archaeon]|nr:radical SAM protein [Candidatus Woesearchaeota archaeon]